MGPESTLCWILEVRSWSYVRWLDMMFILTLYLELDLSLELVGTGTQGKRQPAKSQEWWLVESA